MAKILVTGGAGFIGSHIVEELLARGFSVVVLDDLSTGKLENLPPDMASLRIIVGSILNPDTVCEAVVGCDAVIHLAAIASVQASIENPIFTHQVNFDGTLLLLEYARQAGVKRFLFASSAAVYGNATEGAVSENVPVSPLTPYAIDKLAGEYYLKHYYRTFGLEYTAFRFFNVYGPRQNPASPYSGVISIFAANSIAGKPLKVFGDGKQTRDFVYVKDVARMLVATIKNHAMSGKVINIGTGESTSLLDIIEKMGMILNKTIEVEYTDARVGDIRHSLADVRLLRSLCCETTSTSILDGLRATIQT
ncbi:MAG: NAD-dependent epimerase/dehydratase family protein [Gallionella sp.]